MADLNMNGSEAQLTIRHRSRIAQIGIFFRKFLRMFVYQSDWKMLPMAALIAGLVGFVLGEEFGKNMEGTLMGAFAVVCVCIWNGSFNSIQVICRERDVIKREHRSGMHITSYILAHMMYQLLMCLLQTVVTLVVLNAVGMKFEGKGLFTPYFVVDAGITMLLIIYASDLLSLWISSLVHSTTTAMTIMPFVLIFQLIFSGGIFQLPSYVDPVIQLTISSPGLKAMASQTQINDLPYATVNTMLNIVDDVELGGRVTVGQLLDALGDTDNQTIAELRKTEIGNTMTVGEVGEDLLQKDAYKDLRDYVLIEGQTPAGDNDGTAEESGEDSQNRDSGEKLHGQAAGEDVTVGQVIAALMEVDELDEILNTEIGYVTTFGEAVDFLSGDAMVQSLRDEGLTITTTLGDILDLVGREETKESVVKQASAAMYNPDYAYTKDNIVRNWLHLLIFIAVFAALSTITLKFIDKDKR